MRHVYDRTGLRERWDDAARVLTTWNTSGVQTSQRAYTAAENAQADIIVAAETANTNKRTIQQALVADLTALQVIIDETNANINTNPAARIKTMSRAIRRLTRLALDDYSGTE